VLQHRPVGVSGLSRSGEPPSSRTVFGWAADVGPRPVRWRTWAANVVFAG